MISLCNSMYNILNKIITNQIKSLLPNIISKNLWGFLAKRKIIDNIILIPEAIHSSVSKRKQCMSIKHDLENSFDWVKHNFIYEVLGCLGSSSLFIDWIRDCIGWPWIAILEKIYPLHSLRILEKSTKDVYYIPFCTLSWLRLLIII